MSVPPGILQVLPALRSGGVERGTLEIAEAIVAKGWRSYVASGGGPLVPFLEEAGTVHITLPLGHKSPLTIWKNAQALRALIREHNIGLIHARSRAPAWAAWLAARSEHIPFITTFHGAYGIKPRLKRQYNAVMTRGRRVIAVSEFIREHILYYYGVPAERIRVIPRGVDTERFNPARIDKEAIRRLRTQWGCPEGAILVLLPGRITRLKGQDVLIRAMETLQEGYHAVLLGDAKKHTPYNDVLDRLIRHNRLDDRVHFASHMQNMPLAYAAADIVVCPSTQPESFGRTVIEAQAMRRPVIATAHGGAVETICHDETGWLLPPGDDTLLAAALQRVAGLSRGRMEKILDTARWNAETFYTLETMRRDTLAVYEEVLRER